MLVVDDAHDADEASLRLLHYLSRIAVGERIVIVVAHRPWPLRPAMDAMRRSLIGRGTSVPLDLGPLADDDIRRLAAGPSADDEVLLDRVVKLAGGNPFAAVELARIAASGDDRAGPMGALVLRGLGDAATAASPGSRSWAPTFDTDEYVALSGVGEEQAYALLDEALAAGAVERTGAGYRFRHSLVRDALLDGLPPHRLLPLHRQAAEALRGLGASPARIGHQLLQAGDVAAAAPFLLQAARTDAAIGAYRDALALIDAVRHDVRDPERGPLLALRADMLMATGDAGAVLAYREALARRPTTRPSAGGCCRGWPGPPRSPADYATAAEALDGLEPDGSADDAALLLPARDPGLPHRRPASGRGGRGRGAPPPRGGRSRRLADVRPDLTAGPDRAPARRVVLPARRGAARRRRSGRTWRVSMFDSHLCVAEFLLYGPTPYAEVLALAATLRESARRSGVLRAVAFATALRGEAALLSGDLALAEAELTEAVAAAPRHRLHRRGGAQPAAARRGAPRAG